MGVNDGDNIDEQTTIKVIDIYYSGGRLAVPDQLRSLTTVQTLTQCQPGQAEFAKRWREDDPLIMVGDDPGRELAKAPPARYSAFAATQCLLGGRKEPV